MFEILHDVRFTWRSLRKHPAFALTAILTLALSIGINTGVFTLINSILLKPLPVSRPERLVELYTSRDGRVGGVTSYADLKDLERGNSSFAGVSGHSLLFANMNWLGRSEVVIGEFTTSNYVDVLGIQPVAGRFFTPDEEKTPGGSLVAVIGHRFWQTRYGGRPDVLGQSIQLNGKRYTIVGVMPAGFEGTMPGLAPEVWVPIMMADSLDSFGQIDTVPSPGSNKLDRRGFRWLWVTGRLKDNVTLPQAQSEMQAVMARLATDYPQSNKDSRITLKPSSEVRLNPDLDFALSAGSAFLMMAAGIVLLIACTNVAGMFLARSSARRKEIAVRIALGTGRARLIQQLLIESISIALAGGIGGLLLAGAGLKVLTAVELPIPITVHWDFSPDWRVFLFTFGISLLAGISFGLAPAIQATRRDLITDLKGGDNNRRSRSLLRHTLVVAQLALALVLLVSASLLLRSLNAASRINLGFTPANYALVQLNLGMYGYEDSRAETFYSSLRDRIRRLPGVESVTMADRTPLGLNINTTALFPSATPGAGEKPMTFDNTSIEPDYFETMRVPILEGRAISERDLPNTPRVAVVSQAMAKQLWPGESAIGKQMRSQAGTVIEIVGVSRDYKVRTVGEAPRPMIHFARRAAPNPSSGLLIRTSGPAAQVLAALRNEISAMDPEVVPFQLTSLDAEAARSLFPVRAGAAVLAGLGTFAVFLAGVGLYGLIAYSVSRRTREMGTRIALGATRGGIVKQVLVEGLKLVALGTVAGMVGAAVVGRLMESLLYGVGSMDLGAFAAGTAILGLVTLLANAIPAITASRVDPLRALKMD